MTHLSCYESRSFYLCICRTPSKQSSIIQGDISTPWLPPRASTCLRNFLAHELRKTTQTQRTQDLVQKMQCGGCKKSRTGRIFLFSDHLENLDLGRGPNELFRNASLRAGRTSHQKYKEIWVEKSFKPYKMSLFVDPNGTSSTAKRSQIQNAGQNSVTTVGVQNVPKRQDVAENGKPVTIMWIYLRVYFKAQ